MSISSDNRETIVGIQKKVFVRVNVPAYNQGQGERPSEYEKVEFKIDSPRPGDVCVTVVGTTTNVGQASATCTATSPGEMLVYVRSLDKGDESGRYVLNFTKPTVKRSAPTVTTTHVTTIPTVTTSPTTIKKSEMVQVISSRPPTLWERILKFFHF